MNTIATLRVAPAVTPIASSGRFSSIHTDAPSCWPLLAAFGGTFPPTVIAALTFLPSGTPRAR